MRKVLGALTWGLLVACQELPGRPCEASSECASGQLCEPALRRCVAARCEPDCAPHLTCMLESGIPRCDRRYTAVRLLAPEEGLTLDGGTVAVTAQLIPSRAHEQLFPPALSFSARRPDGTVLAGGFAQFTYTDAGTYGALWQTPSGDGTYTLMATYADDAGTLDDSVQLTLDHTPPDLQVVVRGPPLPANSGGFTHTDPNASGSWPRDRQVEAWVESSSTDLDPSSLRLTVRGSDGTLFLDRVQPSLVACTSGALHCGKVDLPLWQPTLPAFQGTFAVTVEGHDRLGNGGQRAGSIPVTRWKWAFDASGGGTFTIKSPPAIGHTGTVYVGTAATTTGQIHALHPDGTVQWAGSVGAVVAGPMVGDLDAGTESVYVLARSSTATAIVALHGSGGERGRCSVGSYTPASDLALLRNGGLYPGETALAIVNSNKDGYFTEFNFDPVGGGCMTGILSDKSQPPASATVGPLVVVGESFFYATPSPAAVGYEYNRSAQWWQELQNWPVALTYRANGFALVGNELVGSFGETTLSQGALFSTPRVRAGGAPSGPAWKHPTNLASLTRPPAIGPGSLAYFWSARLGASSSPGLYSLALGGTSLSASTSSVGTLENAPVLASNSILYTASADTPAKVSAVSTTNLALLWSTQFPEPATVSPTLDCARSAGVGRNEPFGFLYVPAGGKLYALVVDSPRLDAAAPWPKFQHDARNTGNPATPVTSCPLP